MATDRQIQEHIEQFAPIIQRMAREKGYKVCSPIIAQSITESVSRKDPSGWSVLKYRYHNMFGMKCGRDWLKAGKPSVNLKTGEEYTKGIITMINDYFRVFSDFTAGIEGYFNFISSKRYAALKTAESPEEYLAALKKSGYATSSTYINTNLGHIDRYGLRKYDDSISKPALPVLKKGATGQYVAAWQTYLNGLGLYDGKIDAIFGERLFVAVKAYQKQMGLVVDGIIGAKTWASV